MMPAWRSGILSDPHPCVVPGVRRHRLSDQEWQETQRVWDIEREPGRLGPLEFYCALDLAPPYDLLYLRGERVGYSVYRIEMCDGSAYIGITAQQIAARVAQHMWVDTRPYWPWIVPRSLADRGTPQIVERLAAGCVPWVTCVASGLSKSRALEMEWRTLVREPAPLNRLKLSWAQRRRRVNSEAETDA